MKLVNHVIIKLWRYSMKIYLFDNAIDSFEWSLRHLRTFLETDSNFENPDISTTYLKQAILCLNSALELFLKKELVLSIHC